MNKTSKMLLLIASLLLIVGGAAMIVFAITDLTIFALLFGITYGFSGTLGLIALILNMKKKS